MIISMLKNDNGWSIIYPILSMGVTPLIVSFMEAIGAMIGGSMQILGG